MTLIYRVENKEKQGPYTANIDYEMADKHDASDDHLSPLWDDSLRMEPKNGEWFSRHLTEEEFCGFKSREQLDQWFEGFHGSLTGRGFHVSVYSAQEVRHGQQQSVFVLDSATKIREESL